MNLAQAPTCPAPSSRFLFRPIPSVPPLVPPAAGSYRMKVLQFLDRADGVIAFGKATQGTLFCEIHEAIGGENTLGATLHRMRRKGFVESTGGFNQTRYRLTSTGRIAVADASDEE